jgi:hypothetical protein
MSVLKASDNVLQSSLPCSRKSSITSYSEITRRLGSWICFRPQVKGWEGIHTTGSVRNMTSSRNWNILFITDTTEYVPPRCFNWRRKQFPFPKHCVPLEHDTMDKVQKHSDAGFIIYANMYDDAGILSGKFNVWNAHNFLLLDEHRQTTFENNVLRRMFEPIKGK